MRETVFTNPAWTIAAMLVAFAGVTLIARPLMAVILTVYTLIIGIFYPSVDIEPMNRLIGHLSH